MPKILIVEDDHQTRQMLRDYLHAHGYEVVEASDGNEALIAFTNTMPDLVMTDIVMPDREGISTIMELRKKVPSLKIIAFSGGGLIPSEEYLGYAVRLGADRAFAKPLDMEALVRAIEELLTPPTSESKRHEAPHGNAQPPIR